MKILASDFNRDFKQFTMAGTNTAAGSKFSPKQHIVPVRLTENSKIKDKFFKKILTQT